VIEDLAKLLVHEVNEIINEHSRRPTDVHQKHTPHAGAEYKVWLLPAFNPQLAQTIPGDEDYPGQEHPSPQPNTYFSYMFDRYHIT
jgi:hypothetical protein